MRCYRCTSPAQERSAHPGLHICRRCLLGTWDTHDGARELLQRQVGVSLRAANVDLHRDPLSDGVWAARVTWHSREFGVDEYVLRVIASGSGDMAVVAAVFSSWPPRPGLKVAWESAEKYIGEDYES